MEIGKKIKQLRMAKGTTQEKLADYLMVSYQAVSKWENDQAAPDIGLLPKLSTFFGVTIDELFDLEGSAHFERVENMLKQQRQLSDEEDQYILRFLKERTRDDATSGKAHGLLAEFYNHKAKYCHELAKEHAEQALALEPTVKGHHVSLIEACGGAFSDWNYTNKHQLIDYYKAFCKKNPTYRSGYLWLLDQLLHDYRTKEAWEVLDQLKTIDTGHIIDLYAGRIQKLEGRHEEALKTWRKMVETHSEEWLPYASFADELTQLGQYEEAISLYEKSMDIQPKPRYYDGFEAMAHIYEILGQSDQAIEQYERILDLLREEWKITFGVTVESIKQSIEALK